MRHSWYYIASFYIVVDTSVSMFVNDVFELPGDYSSALSDLTAVYLILLSLQLAWIGSEAMRVQGGSLSSTGQGIVSSDVFAHSASSVGEIAYRSWLRQSYVSGPSRGCASGESETSKTPPTGRTLVRLAPGHPETVARAAAVPVSQALSHALVVLDPSTLA